MNQNTVGSFRIEGMLQGRLPAGEECIGKIDEWKREAETLGLQFSFDREASGFSLLPRDLTYETAILASQRGVSDGLRAVFEKFLEAFPVNERAGLFSTLRSVEFEPGVEVQTIYAIAPPGRFETRVRRVDAQTVAPTPKLDPKQLAKTLAIAMAVLLIAVGIASFFIDFKSVFATTKENLVTLKADEVTMDGELYADYLTLGKRTINRKLGGLEIEVARTAAYETELGAEKPGDLSWDGLLAVQNLRRGTVSCELFDKDGKFIYSTDLRLHALREDEDGKVTGFIRLPGKVKVHKIRLVL